MKIRFIRNVLIEVINPSDEIWDKQCYKWNEIQVDSIDTNGKTAVIYAANGDVLLDVPSDSFETVSG